MPTCCFIKRNKKLHKNMHSMSFQETEPVHVNDQALPFLETLFGINSIKSGSLDAYHFHSERIN